nr:MAG: ORF1 [TTV-like mini virus]
MPWFRRRPYRYRRQTWRRRRRIWPWRLRNTFRRRQRTRLYRKVNRKRFYRKKLKKLKLNQWQPKVIRKCSIKGMLCLFQCGVGRTHNNWAMYQKSFVPVREPGGGGWSNMVISLNALYDEYQGLRNWWTQSNKGLPMVRYTGATFKFYRSLDTDYIVIIDTCPPFETSELQFLNTQPSRMLMHKHRIIVPHLKRKNYKKLYVKKKIKPPSYFQNKWYFQQDFAGVNLVMLTTSAISFDQYYLPNDQISNNCTLIALDTTVFQNPNFAIVHETTGYQPKDGIYLYSSQLETPNTWNDVTYLGNTTRYTSGQNIINNSLGNKNTWGNPFVPDYLDNNLYVFISNKQPSNTTPPTNALTKVFSLYRECRYNPLTDTGDGNVAFFKSTTISTGKIWDPPTNPNLIIKGFPLWLMLWGWDDWQRKLHEINQIEINYYLVILTKFVTPKIQGYVFLDKFFLEHEKETDLTETDRQHWHPRFDYQTEAYEQICQTGPGAPKINHSKSIQAKTLYNFFFKWGGCPAPMQEVKNPISQEKFPIPNMQQQTIEIENPNTEKESHLYFFDEKRHYITPKATKRLKTDSTTTTTFVTDGNPLDPKIQQTQESEETTSEEETQTTDELQQLYLINRFKHKLKRRILRLKQNLK